MNWLASLEDQLAHAVRGAGCDSITPRFRPQDEEQYGDLACGVALRIAAVRGLPPEPIAETLAASLSAPPGVRVEAAGGFINLRLSDMVLAAALTSRPDCKLPHVRAAVFVRCAESRNSSKWSDRVTAAAAVQCSLLEGCGAVPTLRLAKPDGATVSIDGGWERVLTDIDNLERVEPELDPGIEPAAIWTMPGVSSSAYVRGLRAERLGEGRLAASIGIELPVSRTPHRRWSALESRLKDIARDSFAAELLLYLSRSAQARDLDLEAPSRHERANIAWYAGSTVERMKLLLPPGEPPPIAGEIELSADERELVKGAMLLPLRLRLAAAGAEVDRFSDAVDAVTAGYQRYMHKPARRLALERGELPALEQLIVAGVHGILSDIIRACPLFRFREHIPP